MNQVKDEKITLPAGKYWIGDLCYVMHARWTEFCEMTIVGNDVLSGSFSMDGHAAWQHHTAYGDGTYYPRSSIWDVVVAEPLGVDAGLIGIIPAALIGTHANDDVDLGLNVTFQSPVTCEYQDGVFIFTCDQGIISIDTGYDPEEEDEEEHYE